MRLRHVIRICGKDVGSTYSKHVAEVAHAVGMLLGYVVKMQAARIENM